MGLMAILAASAAYPVTGLVIAAGIGAWTVVYWAMGHGSYMDMGTVDKPDNEIFKAFLDGLFEPETGPSVLRDYTGMALRYTVPAAPIAIGYFLAGEHLGLMFPLVGLVIATAYLVLSKVRASLPHTPTWFDGFTSYGEMVAGACFYSALALFLI